ncbi:putative uncharacterized protein [Firmicutes bacterium CAG:582]|jgi:hypothetical protein|nr:putative uncharacterized protein [Firmicutes bacterium CAG:582]
MLEVIQDTLLDTIKLLPFLFVAFLIIEFIEHKLSNKQENIISKSGKLGPIVGALLGAVPQCGFSVLATNLYVTRIISLGSLISIYLSTSDELIPLMISHNAPITKILSIVSIKVVIGMISGFLIDLLIRKTTKSDFVLCEDEDCDCDHSIIKSSLIHTLKIAFFILIITFLINILFHYVDLSFLESALKNNKILTPFIASLIGLIPNCASSVMISELYLNNLISLGTTLSGLLTGSGVAIMVLVRKNKNISENLFVIGLIYFIGVIWGLLFNFIGV